MSGLTPPHPETQPRPPLPHHVFHALLIVDVFLAGEIISCLENASAPQCVDLNELSVTLDLYVLTLPVEIEIMADFHHNRLKITSLWVIKRLLGFELMLIKNH